MSFEPPSGPIVERHHRDLLAWEWGSGLFDIYNSEGSYLMGLKGDVDGLSNDRLWL